MNRFSNLFCTRAFIAAIDSFYLMKALTQQNLMKIQAFQSAFNLVRSIRGIRQEPLFHNAHLLILHSAAFGDFVRLRNGDVYTMSWNLHVEKLLFFYEL